MKKKKEELEGVYLEYNVYKFSDITPAHMEALKALGCEIEVDGDNKIVRILRDTSTIDHERCGEPLDALEMIG